MIVGQSAVDRLVKADPNAFGVFQSERVTYLAANHGRQLIKRPIEMDMPEGVESRYTERAVEQILSFTGGSAFYIQRFCAKLVEYMNSERAPVATEADVELVREEFLETLEIKDFDGLESSGYTDEDDGGSEVYRQVLLAVARATRGQTATKADIIDEYTGPRLDELLEDLVMRDVVRRSSGAYYIVVRLYQDWLLKRYGASAGAR